MQKRLYLLVLLLVAVTAVTLTSTYLFYNTALSASESFLNAQATVLSTTLEASLTRYGLRQEIFKDIIMNEKWEGIAFLAFYDKQGMTLLHSNEKLINKKIDPDNSAIKDSFLSSRALYMTLGTGENVFVLDTPLVISSTEGLLRIALHPYPSTSVTGKAKLLFVSVSVTLVIFWVITILFIISLKKRLILESVMAHNERLAMLGRMASVLAHEIRNPLGIIKGFAQYLKEQQGRADDKTLKGIDIIINESKRLELLTDDLLVYARMDDIHAEEFDVSSLIREVATMLSMKEKKIEIYFNMPERLIIMSDKEKLRHVLYNLLQNAYEAVMEGGMISVNVKQAKGITEISISDTGKGIKPDELDKVFTPFYTTKTRGTGLGLAIVDKLVKVIGGNINAESMPDKYTTFVVKLPDLKRWSRR